MELKRLNRQAVIMCLGFVAAFARADADDPTKAANEMAERLRARLTEAADLRVCALVVGASGEGVALVGVSAETARIVRPGAAMVSTVDGVRVEAKVRTVTAAGVGLDVGGKNVMLSGQFTPLSMPTNVPTGFVSHLEAEAVPLGMLVRLLADRSGVNISASETAAKRPVTIFLRNVAVGEAVEEICRTVGLWFRDEAARATVRVMTMDEYADNLASFREETTEAFTLLYPNVIEVAGVIYGLYPDRTLLSLGEQELDEDEENDLARRFRRFRVLEDNGGSQFMDMQATRAGGSSGTRAGSGLFSFSRGSALSRLGQWDQLRDRRRTPAAGGELTQADARTLERALVAGDTNLYETVRGETGRAANIFVSLSRKNNMLIVRTSDGRVMEEIRALVKRLDVPTPMVLMEVKVLELTIDDGFSAKFEYAFNRDTHVGAGHPLKLAADAAQTAASLFEPTFSFAVAGEHVDARIKLLQKDGKVKVLATPTLLTANNEVSRIFSGKEYPIVTGWTAGEAVSSQSGIVTVPSTVEIERKDIGTMLLITPNINADKTVTLRLVQENSEVSPDKVAIPVNGSSTGDGGAVRDVEYVESRSLTGTFVAKDGMAVMAGGLIKETDSEEYWRTPILGSIPFVGWLFRGTEKVKRRTELVVLIRPHVISTPYEGGRISRELMEVLSAHPAKDARASMGVFTGPEDSAKRPHSVADDVKNMTY